LLIIIAIGLNWSLVLFDRQWLRPAIPTQIFPPISISLCSTLKGITVLRGESAARIGFHWWNVTVSVEECLWSRRMSSQPSPQRETSSKCYHRIFWCREGGCRGLNALIILVICCNAYCRILRGTVDRRCWLVRYCDCFFSVFIFCFM
jgi:hypothetical protein